MNENGAVLIERIPFCEWRVAEEQTFINSRLKWLQRNPARPISSGDLFDDFIAKIIFS
jgi:hypothetical protein